MTNSGSNSVVVAERRPIPGKHGGTIIPGGKPGNRGNPNPLGPTPSVIRERLRGSFYERAGLLEEIADGVPMVRTRVVLGSLAKHVSGPKCGELGLAPKEPDKAWVQEIEVTVSATPKDRIAALDLMGRYGLGLLREVSVENVRERVSGTLQLLRKHMTPEQLDAILPELRKVWA